MAIDKVSLNSFGIAQRQQKKQSYQPNFTGSPISYTAKITDNLAQAKTIRYMESLKWLKGEIGGILITAVGTGLVAPIFIGFNPFVKAPKDATPEQKKEQNNVKLYTAMRQPISAALAILFQASVQKYIDKGLDIVFNNKEFASKVRVNLDQQDINTESRVKDLVKKEMKEEGLKKPSGIMALFSKDAKAKRKAFKKDFESRVKAMQNSQLEGVADIFEQTGFIKAGERNMPNNTIADLVNKQIEDYIKDAQKLKKSPEQIAFYKKRAKILIDNEQTLKELFAPVIEAAEKGGDANFKTIEIIQNALKDENINDDVRTILTEIRNKPADVRARRAARTLDRIVSIKQMIGNRKFTEDLYEDALHQRNNVLDKKIVALKECLISDVESANEKTIRKTVKEIARACNFEKDGGITSSVLSDTSTFDSGINSLKKKVFKDITTKYKKLVENHYKSWNQFTKIGVGVLITLPITCTALNWVYPRFMELFFPKLAGVKKAQSPQQQQEQKTGGVK